MITRPISHVFKRDFIGIPRCLSLVLVTFLIVTIPTNSFGNDVSSSFEFNDVSGDFTLGSSPITARFQGGEAKVIGVGELYHTGMNSWMIDSGNTGTISFETPVKKVSLYLRDQTSSVASELTVSDENGDMVSQFMGTDTDWTSIDITVGEMSPGISTITLVNNGTGIDNYTVIDDFSFCVAADDGGDDGDGGDDDDDDDDGDGDGDDDDDDAPMGLEDPIPATVKEGRIQIKLETVATGLTAPNWGINSPADRQRIFVTDQDGILWAIKLDTGEKKVFLDVSDRLVSLGIAGPDTFDERGLLGVAFHPKYRKNGLLYTYTSEPVTAAADFTTIPDGEEANHQSVITEWTVPNPKNRDSVVDPASARILLRIDQPQFNHDGGAIDFGPDKLLYIALGDGGGADDEGIGHSSVGNGLDLTNVLGTILRINPLGSDSKNGEYGIPRKNPFVGHNTIPNEIYAYGFRNPFRMSFDRKGGYLYVGDVGQNDIEEIDIVKKGGNYGWPAKEGTFFFDPNGADRGFVTRNARGLPPGMVDPVAQYDHDEGLAVIGGFVYRGESIPRLHGRYVFGDFSQNFLGNDGRLFYLVGPPLRSRVLEFRLTDRTELGLTLLGFGQDADGELYVLGNTTGVPFGETGVVLKITPKNNKN